MEHRDERILVETDRYRITGVLRLPRDGYRSRLPDYLNSSERSFVALTDVEIMPFDGGETQRRPFLAVSLQHVVMAMPLETGLATCLVTMSLADRLGVSLPVRQRCYQLALLQHIGCTAAASQVAAVMGDELIMRAHAATLDFADRRQMLGFLLGHVARMKDRPAREIL